MTPLPTPIPQALHDGSPIYQVHSDVSPLYWISDPGDLITPQQFSDLSDLIYNTLGLPPDVYVSVWLDDPTHQCNHGFDNWPDQKTAVVAWLHARLDTTFN